MLSQQQGLQACCSSTVAACAELECPNNPQGTALHMWHQQLLAKQLDMPSAVCPGLGGCMLLLLQPTTFSKDPKQRMLLFDMCVHGRIWMI